MITIELHSALWCPLLRKWLFDYERCHKHAATALVLRLLFHVVLPLSLLSTKDLRRLIEAAVPLVYLLECS